MKDRQNVAFMMKSLTFLVVANILSSSTVTGFSTQQHQHHNMDFSIMSSMHRGIITPQPPTFISGMTNNREYSLLYSSANDTTDVRSKMRSLTGVSLSAMRASVRAATGLSLTAMRSTLRVATGVSVTGIMDKM